MAIDRLSFNLAFGAYLIFKSWQLGAGSSFALLDAYFADFLTLIVLLPAMEETMSYLKGWKGRLPFGVVLFSWLYLSFFMEWLAPKWSSFAVADSLDVVAYALGASVYWISASPKTSALKEKGACSSSHQGDPAHTPPLSR